MAGNRKHNTAALRFGPVLKFLLLCLLAGGSALGYVWQIDQIDKLGQDMRAREKQLRQLMEENELRRRQLAQMCSAEFLELKIKELNLGLVQPQPSQVLRLIEPVPVLRGTNEPMQYAAHEQREQGIR